MLIDTAMAAAMIGCSTSHVHNLVRKGILTNHGKRKPWLLSYEEIGQAIDDGKIVIAPKHAQRNGQT